MRASIPVMVKVMATAMVAVSLTVAVAAAVAVAVAAAAAAAVAVAVAVTGGVITAWTKILPESLACTKEDTGERGKHKANRKIRKRRITIKSECE